MRQNIPVQNQPTKTIKSKSRKSPSLARIIIICVIISFFVSAIVGFSASGLGNILAAKILKKEISIPDKTVSVMEDSATIEAVKKIQPAVVSIIVTKDLEKFYQYYDSPFESDPFFEDFFQGFGFPETQQNQEQENGKQQIGGGTGFIISSDGVILTNRHVVSDKNADYTIITNSSQKHKAKILATDPINDVAVLKINADNLPTVELGNSDSLQIGQTVIAIGNAMGEYHNTVTKGVISGLGRAITAGDQFSQAIEELENIIQTDAAINPGNSGGPLINIDGQVIGINTAVDFGGQSIGFAIPINDAKEDIKSVKKEGKIIKPFLGVRYQLINKESAKKNSLPYDYGAIVVRGEKKDELAIIPGSPADKADIIENDIILEVNGQKINERNNLTKIISKCKAGDELTLKIFHKDQEKEIKIKLEERKS